MQRASDVLRLAPRLRHLALVAAVVVANAGAGERAVHADDSASPSDDFSRPKKTPAEARAQRIADALGSAELSIGLFSGVLARPPMTRGISSAQYRSSSVSVPSLAGVTFPSTGGVVPFGLDLDFALHGSRMTFPMLGLRAAILGGGNGVSATYALPDSPSPTTASVSLAPSAFGEVLLPGIGIELHGSALYFRATARPAVQIYSLSGTLAQGFITEPVTSTLVSFGLDASFDLCARRSVFSNVCLTATPLLWRTDGDQGAVSGVLFGLGWRAIGTPSS